MGLVLPENYLHPLGLDHIEEQMFFSAPVAKVLGQAPILLFLYISDASDHHSHQKMFPVVLQCNSAEAQTWQVSSCTNWGLSDR